MKADREYLERLAWNTVDFVMEFGKDPKALINGLGLDEPLTQAVMDYHAYAVMAMKDEVEFLWGMNSIIHFCLGELGTPVSSCSSGHVPGYSYLKISQEGEKMKEEPTEPTEQAKMRYAYCAGKNVTRKGDFPLEPHLAIVTFGSVTEQVNMGNHDGRLEDYTTSFMSYRKFKLEDRWVWKEEILELLKNRKEFIALDGGLPVDFKLSLESLG